MKTQSVIFPHRAVICNLSTGAQAGPGNRPFEGTQARDQLIWPHLFIWDLTLTFVLYLLRSSCDHQRNEQSVIFYFDQTLCLSVWDILNERRTTCQLKMALFGTAGVIYFGTARQILLPLDPKHSQSQVHSWLGSMLMFSF